MENSRRDLFIDIFVDRFIFENNQITLCRSFTLIPKTDVGLPKTGVSFYCVDSKLHSSARVASIYKRQHFLWRSLKGNMVALTSTYSAGVRTPPFFKNEEISGYPIKLFYTCFSFCKAFVRSLFLSDCEKKCIALTCFEEE